MECPDLSMVHGRRKTTPIQSAPNRLIGVVIHEVGHNWFPMIINSERQWTWMDEGLNAFVQSIAEAEVTNPAPSEAPRKTSCRSRPAKSDFHHDGPNPFVNLENNAYAKPCAALNVLRESVLGRELADFAFRGTATAGRSADLGKQTSSDLEDASGGDLDWFWRGWFMTTDHVDIAIENVRRFELANAVEMRWLNTP